jgi:hypothetical protein
MHDATSEPTARAELRAIRAELERLLGIYGEHERFRERATALVELLTPVPARSYRQSPAPRESGELTFAEQVALGQCAQDGAALPVAWALRWVQPLLRSLSMEGTSTVPLAGFFAQLYRERHGEGLMLPLCPGRLRHRYLPASPTFDGTLKWVNVNTTIPSVAETLPRELRALVQKMSDYLRDHDWKLPERLLTGHVPGATGGGAATALLGDGPRRGYRIPLPPWAGGVSSDERPVTLDLEKVVALQKEQERVTALLDPVFAEDPLAGCTVHGPAVQKAGTTLLGLDPVASAFLRVLLGKPSWARRELATLAREQGLPLNGMLERLNETSYEQLDLPLFDEGDPLVLNPEVLEKVIPGVVQ